MSEVLSMLENKTTPLPMPLQAVYSVRRDAEPARVDNNRVLSLNAMSFTEVEGR
jgi:hypothetical protein